MENTMVFWIKKSFPDKIELFTKLPPQCSIKLITLLIVRQLKVCKEQKKN